jgi:hypothetical protein
MPSGREKRKTRRALKIYNDTLKNGGYCFLVSKLATSPVCSLKLCLYFKCGLFYRTEKEGETQKTGDERREENKREGKTETEEMEQRKFFCTMIGV